MKVESYKKNLQGTEHKNEQYLCKYKKMLSKFYEMY
jgi:hypothetical protein